MLDNFYKCNKSSLVKRKLKITFNPYIRIIRFLFFYKKLHIYLTQ